MRELPNHFEQDQTGITISPEIRESLTPEELAEYGNIKIELKDILMAKGIWSPKFDVWMDNNIDRFGFWGKSIEAIGKWMEHRPSRTREEELEHFRSNAHSALKGAEDMEAWLPAFEKWITEGPADTLKRAGELMDTIGGPVSASVWANKLVKDMEKGKN